MKDYFCFKEEVREQRSTASFPLEPPWSYGLSLGLPLSFEAKMDTILEIEMEDECPVVRDIIMIAVKEGERMNNVAHWKAMIQVFVAYV